MDPVTYVQHPDPHFAVCQIPGCETVVRNTDEAKAQHAAWHAAWHARWHARFDQAD